MEIALTIIYTAFFFVLISKMAFFNDTVIPKYWFVFAFGLKVIFGILLTLVYTNYYTDRLTADVYKYFNDSKIIFDALKTNPTHYLKMLFGMEDAYFEVHYYQQMKHWYRTYGSKSFSDSHIIIRFNALVRLFSLGYIHVHAVFINFLSLIGLTAIFKVFREVLPDRKKLLFYVIFLVPSVLFWGSGVLKEGILLFSIGLLVMHFIKILKKFRLHSLLIIGISSLFIVYTKYYLVLALSLPLLSFVFYHTVLRKKIGWSYAASLFSIILPIFLLVHYHLIPNPVETLIHKQADFIRFSHAMESNSLIDIPTIKNMCSLIVHAPNAWLNTFVRPFLWESNTLFMLSYSIENLFILTFGIICILFKRKNLPPAEYTLLSVSFVIILFTLIGLTTPVFGSITRYKVPALPFLLIFFVSIVDQDKLKKKYPLLNKLL